VSEHWVVRDGHAIELSEILSKVRGATATVVWLAAATGGGPTADIPTVLSAARGTTSIAPRRGRSFRGSDLRPLVGVAARRALTLTPLAFSAHRRVTTARDWSIPAQRSWQGASLREVCDPGERTLSSEVTMPTRSMRSAEPGRFESTATRNTHAGGSYEPQTGAAPHHSRHRQRLRRQLWSQQWRDHLLISAFVNRSASFIDPSAAPPASCRSPRTSSRSSRQRRNCS